MSRGTATIGRLLVREDSRVPKENPQSQVEIHGNNDHRGGKCD